MKIGGVIAEYNPFHTGHQYQLRQMRRHGVERIVVVMSGNFVQRGDVAVLNKFARARAAVQCGADLVIELPTVCSLASAERFAWGGIFLLESLGCVQALSFGCENDSIRELESLASAVDCDQIQPLIRDALKKGICYPAARTEAVRQLLGPETAALLTLPNNILAVEYLRSCRRLGSGMEILPVRRKGAAHDGEQAAGGTVSASELRRRLTSAAGETARFMPDPAQAILEAECTRKKAPAQLLLLERALLCRLRSMGPEELLRLPDVSEGLENRICSAARTSCTLEELLEKIRCRRYPVARIRRILLYAFLGITREELRLPPPYIRILAANRNGFDILRAARETAALPILMKAGDVRRLDREGQAFYGKECLYDDLYALACPQVQPCGSNQTGGIQIPREPALKSCGTGR